LVHWILNSSLHYSITPVLQSKKREDVVIEFLWVPFLACLVLTGIHVYLGLHVARGIIFVDLALAQVAALGTQSRCWPGT
jgi:hypothetical protein